MIPFLHLGPVTLPTYGLMVACAMVAAYYVLRADMARRGLGADSEATAETFIAIPCLAGIVGAKLYHVLETPADLFADPWHQIFSQFGFAWFGGLTAGFAAFAWLARRYKIPLREMFDAGSPAAALGYGIGRIGCLLSGDGDYGIPTSLPWGMSHPERTCSDYRSRSPHTDLRISRGVRDCLDSVAHRRARDGPRRRRCVKQTRGGKSCDGRGCGSRKFADSHGRTRFRGVSGAYGRGAVSGGIYSYQSAVIPRNVQRRRLRASSLLWWGYTVVALKS